MSYQPLHQKYRPDTFASLVGQEAITTTLNNAITTGKIATAYLFTGPRGTGKTSSARILAKCLNCLSFPKATTTPCGECVACKEIATGISNGVIEIDAASNTGVDNIRDVITAANVNTNLRYKVYVIDECHMLSVAAFNALLKTLEEPPKNVVFILATTDPQRVLPTIISRCQRFDYRRIPLDAMIKHLKAISLKEEININDQALKVVAQIANGGLRDAQSLLDQLSLLSGEITPIQVWDLVGTVSEGELLALVKAISAGDAEEILQKSRAILNGGKEPLTLLQNLANFYVNLLVAKTSPQSVELVQVTPETWAALTTIANSWEITRILQGQQHLKESEVQIKNTTQPRLWLEITLLGLLNSVYTKASPIVEIKSLPASTPANTINNVPVAKVATEVAQVTKVAAVEPPAALIPKERIITSIYTDGACSGNPGPGGWAFVAYFNDGSTEEDGGGPVPNTTNNRMELEAAIEALKFCKNSGQKEAITLYTDSEYVKKGATQWLKNWKRNSWQNSKGEPVVNQDLWEILDQLNSPQVTWEYVKGHSGDVGNDRCDEIARRYAQGGGQDSIGGKKKPENISASEQPNSFAGEEVWLRVIDLVQPTSTQTLLRQHCSLVAFDGNYGVVAVKSSPLLKIVSARLENLEKAFEQYSGHRINISLQVGPVGEKKNDVTPPVMAELPPVVEKEPIQPRPEKLKQENVVTHAAKKIESTSTAIKSKDKDKKPVNYSESELYKVAESWARFFDGEIIS